ncbi:MAG TPA: TonB C-terminal domain-containing protein [Sulfuricurvum sp.]|nr:TonB C-terminal domain-containing protein [Sulfuricurvum sp.]
MKRHSPSFSLYAFLIALLVHIVMVLLLTFIEKIAPTPLPKEEQPVESRFKVSLKEKPKAQKEALVKNTLPKPLKARPMPKGEQLKTPTQKAKSQPEMKPKEKQPPSAPKAQPDASPKETTATPTEPKKAFERHVAKDVATIDRKPAPKQEKGLYDILSQADSPSKPSSGSSAKISNNIQKLYGDKFGELSEGEQKYILDNQEIMRRITQTTLDRYGRARIPDNLKADETNMIEFYLHPDGSISDIRFLKNSRFSILDDTTKETIEIAYSKYPRPAQKTYIRYRVWYNLN